MPIHALAGHLVLISAPLTALVALVYAWRPRSRAGMRTPLIVISVLTFALAVWTETVGSALYEDLKRTSAAAGTTPPSTVLTHAHQGDGLTVASLALSVAVPALVWWLLRPGRCQQRYDDGGVKRAIPLCGGRPLRRSVHIG